MEKNWVRLFAGKIIKMNIYFDTTFILFYGCWKVREENTNIDLTLVLWIFKELLVVDR